MGKLPPDTYLSEVLEPLCITPFVPTSSRDKTKLDSESESESESEFISTEQGNKDCEIGNLCESLANNLVLAENFSEETNKEENNMATNPTTPYQTPIRAARVANVRRNDNRAIPADACECKFSNDCRNFFLLTISSFFLRPLSSEH